MEVDGFSVEDSDGDNDDAAVAAGEKGERASSGEVGNFSTEGVAGEKLSTLTW